MIKSQKANVGHGRKKQHEMQTKFFEVRNLLVFYLDIVFDLILDILCLKFHTIKVKMHKMIEILSHVCMNFK